MKTESINDTEKHANKIPPGCSGRMEAIACGVQARYEEKTGYAKIVTDETINIARSLGVADSEIERWANGRMNRIAHDMARIQEIKSLLQKVEA